MTQEQNLRLKMYQCADCRKILKGSQYKKHKKKTGHKRCWRRQFCSSMLHETIQHAEYDDQEFTKDHRLCEKQRTAANADFRQFVVDIRLQHPDMPPNTDDEEEEVEAEAEAEMEEEEEEEEEMNSDEEAEQAIANIRESSDEEPAEAPTFITNVAEKVAETSENVEENAEKVEKEKAKKTPRKGIASQSKRWNSDLQKQAVSRQRHTENLMDRYSSLKKQNDDLKEAYEKLSKTYLSAKLNKEEADMQRAVAKDRNLQLANSQAKVATLEARLNHAFKENAHLQESNECLKKELEKECRGREAERLAMEKREILRQANDFQLMEIHIPLIDGNVADEVLAFDMNEEEGECYGDNCLHLQMLNKGGRVKITQKRRRKRIIQAQEPEHQRLRMQ